MAKPNKMSCVSASVVTVSFCDLVVIAIVLVYIGLEAMLRNTDMELLLNVLTS